uniref:Uncharacterized protein n=1 Tax=Glossina palpalis gambiensis TaxID=67801 RepID=A0A1B0BID2_9MUSC
MLFDGQKCYVHHIENLYHIRHLLQIVDRNHNISLSIIFVLSGVLVFVFVMKHILKKHKFNSMKKSFQTALTQTMAKPKDGLNLEVQVLSP